MKFFKKIIYSMAALIAPHSAFCSNYQLWYTSPAASANGQGTWIQQTLPIGNGRIGGTIYGTVPEERIQMNESSVWTGGTTSGGTGKYLFFSELLVNVDLPGGNYSNYRRDLDIGDATAHVSYTANNIDFKREFFCSFPDSVMVIHLTASSPGALSLKVSLNPQIGGKPIASGTTITHEGVLGSDADLPDLKYEGQVRVKNYSGSLVIEGDGIRIINADSVDLIFAAATNFGKGSTPTSWRAGGDPHAKVSSQISLAGAKTFSQLRNAHLADYQNLFNRFFLDLNDSVGKNIPTNKRREAYQPDNGKDRGLDVLLTQYGRYLLIASSRNALPANLQGLWSNMHNPPWRSDYHSNINVQMNYSHPEPLNLAECVTPFINFVNNQRDIRHIRTQEAYPGVRGWTVQTETNPMGGNTWNWNNPGSAWYCNLLWDHFRFNMDTVYLRNTALPIMKEVCQFWQDRLIMKDGKLVAPDGDSPENHGGSGPGVSYAQQLVWDVFTNYSKAEAICKVDPIFKHAVDSMLLILEPGLRIGHQGDLQEWAQDVQGEGNHRHLSHLVGLYPGSQIGPFVEPKIAKAAEIALTMRGDGSTGWSAAWRADCWARLLSGDKAYHQLGLLVKNFMFDNLWDHCNGEYQIDGNFGFASAVAEMLIQSQGTQIHLLPALPTAWPAGTVKGLRARGGYTIDMNWSAGSLVSAVVVPSRNGLCQIRTMKKVPVTLNGIPVVNTYTHSDSVVQFQAQAGVAYILGAPGVLSVRSGKGKTLGKFKNGSNKSVTPFLLNGKKVDVNYRKAGN